MNILKFFFIVLLFFSVNTYSQSKSATSAWLWSDSTNAHTISIFFKKNNQITQVLDIAKNRVVPNSNTKKGKYLIKGDILEITWDDGTKEERKIEYINGLLQMTIQKNSDTDLKGVYIFYKVVDEEVKP